MAGFMQDGVPKSARHGSLKLEDGTPTTPNSVTLVGLKGDYTYNRKTNVVPSRSRGDIDGLLEGDEELASFSFSGTYRGLHASGANPTAYEVLYNEGGGSAWVSTSGDETALFSLGLIYTCTDNDGSTETITAGKFFVTDFKLGESMDGNTIEFSGVCRQSEIAIGGAA